MTKAQIIHGLLKDFSIPVAADDDRIDEPTKDASLVIAVVNRLAENGLLIYSNADSDREEHPAPTSAPALPSGSTL